MKKNFLAPLVLVLVFGFIAVFGGYKIYAEYIEEYHLANDTSAYSPEVLDGQILYTKSKEDGSISILDQGVNYDDNAEISARLLELKNSFPAYFDFDAPQGFSSPYFFEKFAFSAPVNFESAATVKTISNSLNEFKVFNNFGDMFISGYNKTYEKEGVSGLLTFDVSLKNSEAIKNLEWMGPLDSSEKMLPENKIDSDIFDELYAIPNDEGVTVAYAGVKFLSDPIEYYDFSSLKSDYSNNFDDYKESFDCVLVNIWSFGDVGFEAEEILNKIK